MSHDVDRDLVRDPDLSGSKDEQEGEDGADPSAGKPVGRVLIVDDDALQRQTITRRLASLGFPSDSAADIDEAADHL